MKRNRLPASATLIASLCIPLFGGKAFAQQVGVDDAIIEDGIQVTAGDIDNCPYHLIQTVTINVTEDYGADSRSKIYGKLRVAAKRVGADAVVKVVKGGSHMSMWAFSRREYTGRAIRFVDQSCNPARPAPTPVIKEHSMVKLTSPKEIALVSMGGVYTVPVTINDAIKLHFIIDSGASDVAIPADVVLTMIRTGTLEPKDFIGKKIYTLADGSQIPSYSFTIKNLKLGDVTIENVTGSVGDVNGPLLLGQSFLSRLESWSFDNQRRVLVIGNRTAATTDPPTTP